MSAISDVMKSWFVQWLAPVITRHGTQFLMGLLMGFAVFKGHETELEPIVLQAVSAFVSAAVLAWAGSKVTPAEVLKTAVEVPGVIKEQTTIVVNDRQLAAKTPAEVVYGQDTTIQ